MEENLSAGHALLSPLARAALDREDELVHMIEDGADIDGLDDGVSAHENPIILAAKHGQCDVLRALIRVAKHPPNLNAIAKTGMTALKVAVLNNDLESVNILLRNGARVDVTSASGVTPLMLAVLAGETARSAFSKNLTPPLHLRLL